MTDQSQISRQRTLWECGEHTFSAASQDGPLPCVSLAGPPTSPSTPAVVPANRSRRPAKGKPKTTRGTSGPSGSTSFASDILSASLASRFKTRLGMVGSMEYSETWKQKATPAGRLYWEHTASARRTSANDCSGWPTPALQNADGGINPHGNTGEHFTLQTAAAMTGWPTPDSSHHGSVSPEAALARIYQHRSGEPKRSANLDDVAVLAGWPTPQVCEGPNNGTNRGDGQHRARNTPQNVPDLVEWPGPPGCDAIAATNSNAHSTECTPLNVPAHQSTNGETSIPTPLDLAGWVSPSSLDWKDSPGMATTGINPDGSVRDRTDQLPRQAQLTGWPTCRSTDGDKGVRSSEGAIAEFARKGTGADLPTVATLAGSGPDSTSSSAETERRGVLNAGHTRWLMGFPPSWEESSPGWKQWDSVQRKLNDSFGTPEAFSQWLLEIALADCGDMATPLFPA